MKYRLSIYGNNISKRNMKYCKVCQDHTALETGCLEGEIDIMSSLVAAQEILIRQYECIDCEFRWTNQPFTRITEYTNFNEVIFNHEKIH